MSKKTASAQYYWMSPKTVRKKMQKENKPLLTLAALASVLGFFGTPLLAQTPKNEPAAKAGETPSPSAAEASENAPQTPVITPQAERLLRAMGDYLKPAKAFSFHADIMYDDFLASGQKIQFTATSDVAIRRPDRISFDFEGDGGRKRFWYDGQSVTLYDKVHQVYGTEKTPPGIEATLEYVTDQLGFTPPLSDFLFDDPGNVLLQDVIFGVDLGESDVGGVNCRHLAFVQTDIDWQIWIEQGKLLVPRKLVITYKKRPGVPEYIALLSDWDFTTPIADSLFSAEIPPGAEAISFLKLKPEVAPEKANPAEPPKNQ
jgi:hypothetical protein